MQNPVPAISGKSSTGLDENIAALLTYVVGWVSGLVFFLIEKDSKLVRFHAMQSILFSVLVGVVCFVGWIVTLVFDSDLGRYWSRFADCLDYVFGASLPG